MFLTTPVRIWPSFRLATSSERASARLSSSTARRDTTMLPRERSILRIWKGCGEPSSGVMSRTGRISTWLPGRNATAPLKSTVKPPLTRPKIVPVTRSLAWKFFSSCVQASSRRAFSRDRDASPFLSSMRSRKTSTVSPTLISGAAPPTPNSLSGTRPSDLRPTSIKAKSFSIEMTWPLRTVPSSPLEWEATPSASSSNAAKFSFVPIWDVPISVVSAATAIRFPRSLPFPASERNAETPRRDRREAGGRRVRARPHRPGPAGGGEEDSPRERVSARLFAPGTLPLGGERTRYKLGGLLEGLIGVEPCRINRFGVGSRRERSDPTQAVARVAFLHVLQDILAYSGGGAAPRLPPPPLGARLGAGGNKQLHGGTGAH